MEDKRGFEDFFFKRIPVIYRNQRSNCFSNRKLQSIPDYEFEKKTDAWPAAFPGIRGVALSGVGYSALGAGNAGAVPACPEHRPDHLGTGQRRSRLWLQPLRTVAKGFSAFSRISLQENFDYEKMHMQVCKNSTEGSPASIIKHLPTGACIFITTVQH